MIITYLKNLILKKNVHSYTYLKNYLKILTYFSYAINGKIIDIIESNLNHSGYSKNKIILPKFINIYKNENNNYFLYVYKILFFIYFNKLNIENINFIYFFFSIKMVRKAMINDYIKIDNIEKKLYKNLNSSLFSHHKYADTFLNIIINKSIYLKQKNTLNLNLNEKILLYKLENLINIKNISINYINNLIIFINKFFNIYLNYNKSYLWGMFYKDNKNLNINYFSNNNINNNTKKKYSLINNQIDKKNIKIKKNNTNELSTLFDYQKTTDKYIKGGKNIEESNDYHNLTNYQTIFTPETAQNNKYIIKNNQVIKADDNVYKKHIYKEWDYSLKNYKNNWCHIFEKKASYQKNDIILQKLSKFNDMYKKHINFLKNELYLIKNKKMWIKKQSYGEDINLDCLIDNYYYIKYMGYNKIYKYKKKMHKDITILFLLDSSLSTDSYINTNKKIDIIKNTTLILSLALNNLIPINISTFFSNTRYDCKYIKIKDFNDNIKLKKLNILNITSQGYTRIGPAIRHSIKLIEKRKEKKKIILLLTDGTPTDYDEYEGIYGEKDVKVAINECQKKDIIIKCIIINDKPKSYFLSMIGLKNFILFKNQNYKLLLNLFKNIN